VQFLNLQINSLVLLYSTERMQKESVTYMQTKKSMLVLEDGTSFVGQGFGSPNEVFVELVFNTSMVGYQEIMSDPSYTDQAVVMTYPLIGNYGLNNEDYETKIPTMSGFVVRDYNPQPSNFRSKNTLEEVMEKYGIAGISGVDTRKIARHIRNFGSCKALITQDDISVEDAVAKIKSHLVPNDAVSRVTTKEVYHLGDEKTADYHIVAIDCGMKANIPRMMVQKNMYVTIVPYNTSIEDILSYQPDGVFISNGPGDPTDVKVTIENIKKLRGVLPIFGICLGHQIISLAYGAKTYKLKFGHRGGNHPVKNLMTDKLEITSQNHSYAVDVDSVKNTDLEITHINLLDNTVEGVRCTKDFVFSVQYHPESAPGPQDSAYLFDTFIGEIKRFKEER